MPGDAPDLHGREPCEPCRGCWAPHAIPLQCWPAVLDELLWALFGWLWLVGGRTELETWCPDVSYDDAGWPW